MTSEMDRFGSTTEVTNSITKVFRDLTVYGDPRLLCDLVPRIESRLADGWSRDRKSEQRLPGDGGQSRFFLFSRRARGTQPAVKLAMCAEGRRLSVTNVIPGDNGRLPRGDYNSILVEFYLKSLQPAAAEAELPLDLSSDEISLEEAFGWRAVELLRRFSKIANKSSTHPADRRRWMEFLIQLHSQPNRNYDLDLLAKWLIEDGWSVDKTHELIDECEFARDLLRAYDQKIAGLGAGDRINDDLAQ